MTEVAVPVQNDSQPEKPKKKSLKITLKKPASGVIKSSKLDFEKLLRKEKRKWEKELNKKLKLDRKSLLQLVKDKHAVKKVSKISA